MYVCVRVCMCECVRLTHDVFHRLLINPSSGMCCLSALQLSQLSKVMCETQCITGIFSVISNQGPMATVSGHVACK